MPQTPDEIKKGQECCARGDCHSCPYVHNCILSTADAIALIQQLQAQNAEKDARIQQLESDKQQLEGLLTHMNQLRDAAAGRALQMEERVHQLEAERDAAVESMRSDPHCCYHCANMTKRGICQSEPRADGHCFEWRGVQKEE